MVRGVVVAAMLAVLAAAASGQPLSTLHIKILVVDAAQKVTPVAEHALLISDNPATSTPRRVVTRADGTADVRLRPGNYTVESDAPVTLFGKGYQWTQTLDILAGRDAVLELTAANAEIGPAPIATATTPTQTSLSSLLTQWQDSVAALWTPTTHASGFVVDANGLVVTNQRAIGQTPSVEVQLSDTLKVAGRVLATDAARDVAVLWIDPAIAASVKAVPLGCAQSVTPIAAVVHDGQDIFTIGAPLRQQKGPAFGTARESASHVLTSDFNLPSGSAGGPVFTASGTLVGLTASAIESDSERNADGRTHVRIIPIDDACRVVAVAQMKMTDAARPSATHLPVESGPPLPDDALKDVVSRRAGNLNPYEMAASDFDLGFITPVQIAGARGRSTVSPAMDFGNWSEYVADAPALLFVRVTPKQVESFWTKVARGAAATQGAAIPPLRHVKSGFSRMQAFCGDAEVAPIHPFTIERRISETDVVDEGLYVFAPDALGPQCASVRVVLYSDKSPEKGDTRTVDPTLLQQIAQDFALSRAAQ